MVEIIRKADPHFREYWDLFVERECLGNYHSSVMFNLYYAMAEGNEQRDTSYVVLDGKEPVAIVPIIVENGIYGTQLSMWGRYLPSAQIAAALHNKTKKNINNIIREEDQAIIRDGKVVLHKCLLNPFMVFGEKPSYANRLLKESYIDCSATTRVLPLVWGNDKIWSGLRKSFRPLISKGLKTYRITVANHTCCDRDLLGEFGKLYTMAAGREVYSPACLDVFSQAVKNDKGLLVLVAKDRAFVGGGLFLHNAGNIYYALGANHPEFEHESVGHVYLWSAINYYISMNFHYLELGWQEYSPQLGYVPSPKERAIAFFKAGFSGIDIPLYRGIKFYDATVGQQYLRVAAENLVSSMQA